MAEEFDIIRVNLLPVAGTITDNDMIIISQGGRAKRALPSTMKGKQGDPGLSAFLGISDKYILWKQGADGTWQNLIEIEALRGPKGEKPLFRKIDGTLQMKYEGEQDSAYKDIFDREELKMNFSDLTAEEVDSLKLHFSDLTEEDIQELQKPAQEVADELNEVKVAFEEFSETAALAESNRVEAEKQRVEIEKLRAEAETSRISAEVLREDSEKLRDQAETERTQAESLRISQEEERTERENTRIAEEQLRINAEKEREEAEIERKTAEELREQNTNRVIQDSEEAAEKAKTTTALMDELNAHPMKPQAGLWYRWNPDTDTYENTGIQAKGDPGQSFKIIGQYDTLDDLKNAVPDGTDIDGVYAVGVSEPFNYYAWIYKDGNWQWVDQGQLRGAEGKSAYEVWLESPDNADKTEADYFAYLRQPATEVAEEMQVAIQNAESATDAANTAAANTEQSRLQIEQNEQARVEAETIRQEQEDERQSSIASAITTMQDATNSAINDMNEATSEAINNAEAATSAAHEAENKALDASNIALNASASLIIPDIDHEPTESDLSYIYNDITYQYKIGGLCRMADPDAEEGYTFFRLYDITAEGKAVWGGAGSGSGSSVPQTAVRLIIDTSMQTGQINVSNIAGFYLLAEKICRVMGALGTDGEMNVCPLDNGNSTLSASYGLPMATDGTDGDMFVMLPDIWYKQEKVSDTQQSFLICGEKPSGKGWTYIPVSLVGAKKGYIKDGKLRSISGVTPTTGLTYEEFSAAALAQGEGYGLISYAQHIVIAMLLYLKYKTFDVPSHVGMSQASYDANNLTGSSDLLGMNDTTAGSVTGYVNALGIEGVYGGFYEFMQGLTLTGTTWHVEESDGTVRDVEAPNMVTGWISHTALEESAMFDLLPTACTGTSSTFYTDFCEIVQSEYIPLVVARSCFTGSNPENNFPDDGLAYINATHRKEEPGEFYSSRLSYFGTITVVNDPVVYRQLITL